VCFGQDCAHHYTEAMAIAYQSGHDRVSWRGTPRWLRRMAEATQQEARLLDPRVTAAGMVLVPVGVALIIGMFNHIIDTGKKTLESLEVIKRENVETRVLVRQIAENDKRQDTEFRVLRNIELNQMDQVRRLRALERRAGL